MEKWQRQYEQQTGNSNPESSRNNRKNEQIYIVLTKGDNEGQQ